jgi:fibronectin-binding autotransporter adhesin
MLRLLKHLYNQVVGSPLSGSWPLQWNGPATLTLTAANTYTGGTVINGGTVQVGNGEATGSLPYAQVTNNANLIYDLSTSGSWIDYPITGSGNVTFTGGASFGFSAVPQTYTGSTTIAAGTSLTLGQGGSGAAMPGPTSMIDNGSFTVNSASNLVMGFPISGTGAVSQEGSAALTLGVSPQTDLQSVPNETGTTYQLTITAGSTGVVLADHAYQPSMNMPVAGMTAGSTFWILNNATSPTTINTVGTNLTSPLTVGIKGVSAVFAYDGARWVYSGNSAIALSYTGPTNVLSGTLSINNVGSGSNNANVGGNQLATSALNIATGSTLNINYLGNFSSANNGTTISGGGTLNFSGGAWWMGNGGTGTAITVAMSAGATINVLTGTLKNDYGNCDWSANLGDLNVAAGATFDVRNNNVWVGQLNGAGPVINSAGTNALTIGAGNADGGYYSGVISGPLSVVKVGSGTQTFAGSSNTFSGNLTISGGLLVLKNGATPSNGTIVMNGGTLCFHPGSTSSAYNYSNNISVTADSTIASDDGNTYLLNPVTLGSGNPILTLGTAGWSGKYLYVSGNISGTGGILIQANAFTPDGYPTSTSGQVIFSGNNTYKGLVSVNSGTLLINSASGLGPAQHNINSGGILSLGTNSTTSNSSVVIYSGGTFNMNGHSYAGSINNQGGTINK